MTIQNMPHTLFRGPVREFLGHRESARVASTCRGFRYKLMTPQHLLARDHAIYSLLMRRAETTERSSIPERCTVLLVTPTHTLLKKVYDPNVSYGYFFQAHYRRKDIPLVLQEVRLQLASGARFLTHSDSVALFNEGVQKDKTYQIAVVDTHTCTIKKRFSIPCNPLLGKDGVAIEGNRMLLVGSDRQVRLYDLKDPQKEDQEKELQEAFPAIPEGYREHERVRKPIQIFLKDHFMVMFTFINEGDEEIAFVCDLRTREKKILAEMGLKCCDLSVTSSHVYIGYEKKIQSFAFKEKEMNVREWTLPEDGVLSKLQAGEEYVVVDCYFPNQNAHKIYCLNNQLQTLWTDDTDGSMYSSLRNAFCNANLSKVTLYHNPLQGAQNKITATFVFGQTIHYGVRSLHIHENDQSKTAVVGMLEDQGENLRVGSVRVGEVFKDFKECPQIQAPRISIATRTVSLERQAPTQSRSLPQGFLDLLLRIWRAIQECFPCCRRRS